LSKIKNFFGILENAFSIPEHMTVNGSIDANTSGRIIGLVNGDVKTSGKITINPEGIVRGNIYAGELLLYGKVFGSVFCSHKATLMNRSYIQGNVRSISIETEEGAVIDGMIENNGALIEQNAAPMPANSIEKEEPVQIKEVVSEPIIEANKNDDENPEHWF